MGFISCSGSVKNVIDIHFSVLDKLQGLRNVNLHGGLVTRSLVYAFLLPILVASAAFGYAGQAARVPTFLCVGCSGRLFVYHTTA